MECDQRVTTDQALAISLPIGQSVRMGHYNDGIELTYDALDLATGTRR